MADPTPARSPADRIPRAERSAGSAAPAAERERGRGRGQHLSDHLANERTFLAWIRTSIAVISLGFVVAKFSIWLRQLGATLGVRTGTSAGGTRGGASFPVGLALIAWGAVLAPLAWLHYRSVARGIDRGDAVSGRRLALLLAAGVFVPGVALFAYLIWSTLL